MDDFKIALLGDTHFGENYHEALQLAGKENVIKTKGRAHSLVGVPALLQDSDLVIANLESPLASRETSPFTGVKKFAHWLFPILSDNRQTGYQPRIVDAGELRTVRELLEEKSAPLPSATFFTSSDQIGSFFELSLD